MLRLSTAASPPPPPPRLLCCYAITSPPAASRRASKRDLPLARQKAAGKARTSPPSAFGELGRRWIRSTGGRRVEMPKAGTHGRRRRQNTHGERGERKGRRGDVQTHRKSRGLTSGDLTRAAGLSHAWHCPPTSPTASRGCRLSFWVRYGHACAAKCQTHSPPSLPKLWLSDLII